MNNQSLIIYDNKILYDIFYEIQDQLQFSIIYLTKKELTKLDQLRKTNYLVLSRKKLHNISNQIVLNKLPINTFKFIERLNIEFLRLKFNEQSKITIGKYLFDLNAREMIYQKQKLRLTEKEINSISYLFKVKKSVNIQELQQKVWGYQFELETHTVETHIYRLRKKIFKIFNDNQFIKSTPSGYKVN